MGIRLNCTPNLMVFVDRFGFSLQSAHRLELVSDLWRDAVPQV